MRNYGNIKYVAELIRKEPRLCGKRSVYGESAREVLGWEVGGKCSVRRLRGFWNGWE